MPNADGPPSGANVAFGAMKIKRHGGFIFETRASALLRMRSWTLMVRSVATPRVSNHEAPL